VCASLPAADMERWALLLFTKNMGIAITYTGRYTNSSCFYIPEANTQREKINNPTPRKVMVIPMEIKIHACLFFFLDSPIPNKRRPKPIIEIHSRGKIILPPSGSSSRQ
jgi:hypothetical protein